MKTKKIISVFLSLVMSIQIIPLQQIAAWLTSGQVTEEIAHNVNPTKAKSAQDEGHPPFQFHTFGSGMYSAFQASLSGHHHDEDLYIRHADDILSPPPNSLRS